MANEPSVFEPLKFYCIFTLLILYFVDSQVEDYSGGRTLTDLMKYVTKMVGTPVEEEKPDFDVC